METLNPYAAPKAEVSLQATEAEQIRRQHINQESSIKTFGWLYIIVGTLFVLTAGSAFVRVLMAYLSRGEFPEEVAPVVLLLPVFVLMVAVGLALRKLKRWATLVAGILALVSFVLGLVNLPQSVLGVVIAAYIAWLMLGRKGRKITSPEYQAIIKETPHVKRRTSIVVWVLLALIALMIGIGIFASIATP